MSLATAALVALAATLVWSVLAYGLARARQRTDLVDVLWGPNFVVVVTTVLIASGSYSQIAWLAWGLVAIWGTRLAWHIGKRHRKTTEDRRYLQLKAGWPATQHPQWQLYIRVFFSQALLAWVVSIPAWLAVTSSRDINALAVVGAIIWVVGFLFESTADRQLAQFLGDASNKGKLLTSGLYKFSRHPNYFGELSQWWGIGLIAVSAFPLGVIGLIGPLTISYLIIFVSGIPLQEKNYGDRADWLAYKTKTSVLIPLPPRS